MCDQKTIEKIDSGKYTVVRTWEHYVKLWSPLIFFLGAIVYTTMWMKDVQANSFPDAETRNEVISWYHDYQINGYTFSKGEKARILDHVNNIHKDHMPIETKDERYMLRKEYVLIQKQLDRIENKINKF